MKQNLITLRNKVRDVERNAVDESLTDMIVEGAVSARPRLLNVGKGGTSVSTAIYRFKKRLLAIVGIIMGR